MIVEKIIDSVARKIKAYPVNSNRASDLGNPCTRYHVFNRTRWQEKTLHDVGLQQVFNLGSDMEDITLKELADAGVKVIEQQKPFEWKEYKITGHVDGLVIIDGQAYPIEIKSSSPFVFDKINTIEDLKHGKYAYLRKYPVQLNLYMLMQGIERGVFLFKNKVNGAYKEIWMDLDYDLGEQTLKKAEAINAHVEAGTVPDPIDYDEMVCGTCPFAHICNVERIGSEVQMVDDKELADLIEKYNALKPLAKEYDEVDEQIKKIVEGKDKLLVGDWYITGKWQDRTVYNVPMEVKQQYKDVSRFWKRSIVKAA